MKPTSSIYAPSVSAVLAAARFNIKQRRFMEGGFMCDSATEYDLTEPEEFVEQPDDVADIEEIDYSEVSDDGDGE